MITFEKSFTPKQQLETILATHTHYILKKVYWYWADTVGVFNTKEEAAAHLGFSSYEEFEKKQIELKEMNRYNEGFVCYQITKLDLVEEFNDIIKKVIDNTIINERDKIVTKSNEIIECLAWRKANKWKEQAIETLKQLDIPDNEKLD